MSKRFNVTGVCIPKLHYMVNMKDRIDQIITEYVKKGDYFTINRARQFGKTTTLYLLEKHLKQQYLVIRLSFEAADELFCSHAIFARGLIRSIRRELKRQEIDPQLLQQWEQPISDDFPFQDLSDRITELCQNSHNKIVLMIDEVDKAKKA